MTSLKDPYVELLALTQLYLLQEYKLHEKICAEPSTYALFKQYALQKKESSPQPPPSLSLPRPPQLQKSQLSSRPLDPVNSPLDLAKPVKATATIMPKTVSPEEKSPPPQADKEPPNRSPKSQVASFTLEPLPPAMPMPLNDVRSLIAEHYPAIPLAQQPPEDTLAKKIGKSWEYTASIPQAVILSFHEISKQQTFLNNICKALEIMGTPAKVFSANKIEQAKGWDNLLQSKELRFIIASDYGINALSDLMKHYREAPKQSRHYLGKIPLFLLSDVSFYLKEPTLKLPLWKALKEFLAAIVS
jgi:hypothetical protein